jgi:hypothetical protein
MAAEQVAPPAYFAGTPARFQAAADVVLQLHDGEHLPAHSQLLASASPVLCDMLEVAASQVPACGKIVLPTDGWGLTKREIVDTLKARVQRQAPRKPYKRTVSAMHNVLNFFSGKGPCLRTHTLGCAIEMTLTY